jgi:hypothetical protein
MNKTPWQVSNTDFPQPKFSFLPIIEFKEHDSDEWHNFDFLVTPDRIVFGGYVNVGFLESGYIERDLEAGESLDETLQELVSELETFYNEGKQYTNRIVCNERM